MRVLALDTTTRAGSLALVAADRVLFEAQGDATRSHAERLPVDLLRAVQSAGLTLGDVDVFAVASGPGSFTGLRIGIATMQGLAFVHGKRMAPVSVLHALALGAAVACEPGQLVGAWMDAHRGEVFSALYQVTGNGPFTSNRLVEIEAAAVADPESTWVRWTRHGRQPQVIAGDGAVMYENVLGGAARTMAVPFLASIIGRLAADRGAHGETVDPAGVQPLYVRRPDAEIARDAQRSQAAKGPA
jgi:tRNA threonylcarbamoyladenosine biosynthesis protein TsaB